MRLWLILCWKNYNNYIKKCNIWQTLYKDIDPQEAKLKHHQLRNNKEVDYLWKKTSLNMPRICDLGSCAVAVICVYYIWRYCTATSSNVQKPWTISPGLTLVLLLSMIQWCVTSVGLERTSQIICALRSPTFACLSLQSTCCLSINDKQIVQKRW